MLRPIRPYWISTTRFIMLSMEEALFGAYAVRGKRLHKRMASCIFQSDLRTSHDMLTRWLFVHNHCPDAMTLLRIVRGSFCEVDDYLQEDSSQMRRFIAMCVKLGHGTSLKTTKFTQLNDRPCHEMPTAWNHMYSLPNSNLMHYSWLMTVWLRINVAASLDAENDKIKAFVDGHLACVRYLDSIINPTDANVSEHHLCELYKPLGRSHYDEDRNFIQLETTKHATAPTPLQILIPAYPDHAWIIEDAVHALEKMPIDQQRLIVEEIRAADYDIVPSDDWDHHKLYYAALWIMMNCKKLHKTQGNATIRDALWFYHGCFIDFIYNAAGKSDEELLTPVKNKQRTLMETLYPHDNRAFTAYDLPDAYHVVISIPLLAEHTGETFDLWKFIQKSLPYCCARRTLVQRTDASISSDLAFWKIFSTVFYCMLMDAYPSDMSHRTRQFDLRYLLHAKQICSDRNLMREALSRHSQKKDDLTTLESFQKENDKGCHLVFTAFRLWVIMMVRNQPHYLEFAKQFIDWDGFFQQTVEMGHLVRKSGLKWPDPFSVARNVLNKTDKKPDNQVYRYRKGNVVHLLLQMLTSLLENDLYRVRMFDPLAGEIRKNILNLFIRVPEEQWLTPLGLSILKLPEYGNVGNQGIMVILKFMEIYYHTAKPKDFEQQLLDLDTHDVQVFTWYFHVIHHLQQIQFQPLTNQQTESIDFAMKHNRHILFPGQALPEHAYSVFVTICCGEIKTLQGPYEFGHADVAFDMVHNQFVCTKGNKKMHLSPEALANLENDKKRNREERKQFKHIPCKNTPVFNISLRGFSLIYQGKDRYLHCPRCAGLHKYDMTGWSGSVDGTYRCKECVRQERTSGNWNALYYTCALCGVQLPDGTSRKCILTVVDPLGGDIFQRLYFCKLHYMTGKNMTWGIPKSTLFKLISQKAYKNLLRK